MPTSLDININNSSIQQNSIKQRLTTNINSGQVKAQTQRLQSIVKNNTLIIVPIVTEILVQKISTTSVGIDSLNNKINKLNSEIDQVNASPDAQGIQIVTAKKNALLNEINQNEKNIEDIKNIIDTLNISSQIFTISLSIAQSLNLSLPAPSAALQQTINKLSL